MRRNSSQQMDKLKTDIPLSTAAPIAILGVPFDNVNTGETIRMIEQMIASRRPHYLATANVDFLVQASRDVELRRILFDAHLVLCDGTPLVWASRLLGNPLPERVAGSDLVPLLLKVAAEKNYRPFFLGATPDSIEQAVKNVREKHPGIDIAGYYSPPFNKLLEMDHEEICKRIMTARPDMLFVGFGCPKQEKWINMHYRSLGVPVSVGVGGTIDFLAGRLARAPRWMQVTGTEWIFRLAQEPGRLFGRYASDLWYFSNGIAAQYRQFRRRKKITAQPPPPLPIQNTIDYNLVQIGPRLDFEMVHQERDNLELAVAPNKGCVLDLSSVDFIDSTGVGLLIRLQKRARFQGRQLLLLSPKETVTRALELMRLGEFFTTVKTLDEAAKRIKESNLAPKVIARPDSAPAVLAWEGEITAANADALWVSTMDHVAARSLGQGFLEIDMQGVTFIDSTGLALLIRTKKYGARQGMKVGFVNPREPVLNVIRLSKLEEYLLNP